MTIIVFLIDTSASMFQRTYVGGRTSLLDVAKSAVETFVKIRQRSPESRIDRYMLLTFEEPPNNIKAGWKENLATFMNELKNLQCYSMTTMGVAVKQAFDILNMNRMTSGIDTYGQGRCPFFLETAVIVLITDGGKLSSVNGVHEDFNLPMNSPIPGSEMTREPFRWDQRLFALVLRLTGTPAVERDTGIVPSDNSPIDAMCEVTGGRSYCITSHRMLNQCIDSLVQKVQNGVVINFEKIGPDPPLAIVDENTVKDENIGGDVKDPEYNEMNNVNEVAAMNQVANTSWYICRKMIYVPRASTQKGYPIGFWPIPESFWPEVTATVLPPRSAHPNVKFSCLSKDPMVIENLPFDKYELEPSPLTQYILARKQPTICWQVFVANSYKNSEVGHPFGYLKASTNLNCVNLFVMPYNYPVILPLLDDLFKVHRWKPSPEWRAQFQNYMRTLPAYYANPMRRALTRMGTPLALAQTLIPENAENCFSYTVMNYLKKLKNVAKVEYDRLCNEIIQRQQGLSALKNQFNAPEQIRVTNRVLIKKELVSHPLLVDMFNSQKDMIIETQSSYIGTMDKERNTVSFRNSFDIPRHRLMQQVARMRNNFLQSDWVAQDQDSAHALPISQMGNYQEYLKKQTPQLREIESQPVRQHMFGNPFKIDKRMMVDEADIDMIGSGSGSGNNRNNKRPNATATDAMTKIPAKRKPGPLPRDLVIRRPSMDYNTPPASPVHSPQPSPIPWLNYADKVFEEATPVNNLAVNGIDTLVIERSRSPSPTLEMACYNPTDSNVGTHQRTYSTSENSTENFYNYSTDDKQISQILKEANSMGNNNSVQISNNNGIIPPDNKKDIKVVMENLQEIESQNLEIRKTLNKLVRKPGKNFTELFNHLKTLKGAPEVQVNVVQLIIKECLRFKRQTLAHLLEEHILTIKSTENK
ncbi:PREDICTED: integrator complex subunit 6-A isoform X2 [Nicrophorus vespilloides]|uniref:Integrator complex subunit 6-A isoform X2 n=1 Tax=Nicrophorus vespilloides TaxID=110193 RepID=A0ABM1N840_NICVS|nr:PREDICTED: integrator complex subunit 6-A isoform X2 [Nicrophorus vespilloides]